MRSVVDLPQPEGPSRTTSLPESVAKLAPSTALAVPQCLLTRSRRSAAHAARLDRATPLTAARRQAAAALETPPLHPDSFDAASPVAAGRTRGSRRPATRLRAEASAASDERSWAAKTLCYIGKTARLRAARSKHERSPRREYQESRIEDEPILGAVLVLPSGTIQPLTLWERVLVALRLTSAKALEARYFNARELLRPPRARRPGAVGAASASDGAMSSSDGDKVFAGSIPHLPDAVER